MPAQLDSFSIFFRFILHFFGPLMVHRTLFTASQGAGEINGNAAGALHKYKAHVGLVEKS
jgi:hypothetical protein